MTVSFPLQADLMEIFVVVLVLIWTTVNVYMYGPLLLTALGMRSRSKLVTDGEVSSIEDLPAIDVLLPAYDEGNVIHQAISSVRSVDYPQEKVSLYVLTEPEDDATRSALHELEDDYRFTTLTVPDEYPGEPNKPRALNYGFASSNGDIVGVVDAEDVVAPDLFKKAARAIVEEDCDFAQGYLDMINEGDGWLNTLFRAEYGHWFQFILLSHYWIGSPVPLGGTTNFFDRNVLIETSENRLEEYGSPWKGSEHRFESATDGGHGSGGNLLQSNGDGSRTILGLVPWDPTNVTEDFELGLFLWKEDYDIAMLQTVTEEESPVDFDGWLKQRTRWQKGKVQTLFQYVKVPPQRLKAKFHLFLQSALPHLGPLNLLAVVLLLVVGNLTGWQPAPALTAMLLLTLLFIPLSCAAHALMYWKVSDVREGKRAMRSLLVFLTLPIYWTLQWMADARALKQVYLGQNHWEKTVHFGRNTSRDTGGNLLQTVTDDFYRFRWVLAVLVVGGTLRLFRLGSQSYWQDEFYSVAVRGDLPVTSLVTMASDPHPPLFYLLLHYWMELFGTSEFSTRMLSVLFGVATIAAVYALGAELLDSQAGLITALLVALSTFHIHHSQNVRMYTVMTLFAVLSFYFAKRLISDGGYGVLVWYVVSTVLMLLTHVLTGLVLVTQNLYFIYLYVFGSTEEESPDTGRWLSAQAFIGLLSLPWIVHITDRILNIILSEGQGNIGWIAPPTYSDLWTTLLNYFGYPNFYPIVGGTELTRIASGIALSLVAIIAVAVVAYHLYRREYVSLGMDNYALPVLMVLVSLGLPFLISRSLVPIYTIRNTIVASIGAYLIVGGLVRSLPSNRLQYVVVAFLVTTSLFTVAVYHETETEEDWATAVEHIESHASEDALVLLSPPYIDPITGSIRNATHSQSRPLNPEPISRSRNGRAG